MLYRNMPFRALNNKLNWYSFNECIIIIIKMQEYMANSIICTYSWMWVIFACISRIKYETAIECWCWWCRWWQNKMPKNEWVWCSRSFSNSTTRICLGWLNLWMNGSLTVINKCYCWSLQFYNWNWNINWLLMIYVSIFWKGTAIFMSFRKQLLSIE